MARRILIIANPVSGRGKGKQLAPALASALAQFGIESFIHFARGAGDAAARARDAGPEPWDGFVVIGGDGTVNEVLNGLTDLSRPIGVLPAGTANVLALELRLPHAADAAARMIAHGFTRSVAVGIVNNKRFLLFCGVGIDGAVAERQRDVPGKIRGKLKWAAPILHISRAWPSFALTVTFPDGRIIENLQSVIVARVNNYGGVLQMTPDIDINSGLLHVMCLRMNRRWQWMWQGLRAFLRVLQPGPQLEVHAVSALHISGAAPYQVDGDFGGTTPLDLSISAEQAHFFAVQHA